jgi:hypothetical protein
MASRGTQSLAEELRVVIRYTTTDVPGPPSERAKRIANELTQNQLYRTLNLDTDYIHLSTEFDSTQPKKAWILYDFNVRDRRSTNQLDDTPVHFFRANYNGSLLALVTIKLSDTIL